MKKTFDYCPKGTCSHLVHFSIEDGKLTDVQFFGGCNGNLKGISALVEGMPCEEAIARLKGITCGNKATSCPDQFAQAIEAAMQQMD